MDWYYSENNQQRGPVDDAQFAVFVEQGIIRPDTLVWNAEMTDWKTYAEVSATIPAAATYDTGQMPYVEQPAICSQCNRAFPPSEMIQYGAQMICAECKPAFFQRIREGQSIPGQFVYAGFWVRFCAKFVDGILMLGVNYAVGLGIGMLGSSDTIAILASLVGYVLQCIYVTYFIGKFGATPGKMALKLKVIRPDGSAVSYGRACGRYFAEILSGLLFCAGYIIAAFDAEKRALHDRICDTRVVRQ